MKLADYKSVYIFDTNGWGFTNVNFYLPTMTNGRKFRIVDTAGYMNNSKINSNSGTNLIEGSTVRTYSINWMSRELIYVGDGATGNCVCIDYSIVN